MNGHRIAEILGSQGNGHGSDRHNGRNAPVDPEARPAPTPHQPDARLLFIIALLAAAYFVAGTLSLRLAFINPSSTPIWPPAGIALASLLIFGYRVWPGIFAGAFFVNIVTAGTLITSIGIASGNTLEGLAGAYMVGRWAGGSEALKHSGGILRFTVLAGLLSTTVSATIGAASLYFAGQAAAPALGAIWLTWWMGDATGALIVAPPLLVWGPGLPSPARGSSNSSA